MLLQGGKMHRIATRSARFSFSAAPELILFLALIVGVLWGCAVCSRSIPIPMPVSVAGRLLLRSAITALLFSLLTYLSARFFGTLPTAILFFCKGLFLSVLLYFSCAQGTAPQMLLCLSFHSLLPLPLYFHNAAALLTGKEVSAFSLLLPAACILFAELLLSQFGSIL